MIETTCYKCSAVVFADKGQVHPLCLECNKAFEDWFDEELRILNGGAS
jgi:hypothetical protein